MTAAFGAPSHRHGHVSPAGTHAVRVGVVGTGIMGADHARTLHLTVGGATVSAIADADRSRAATLAAELDGVRVVDDADRLIADDEVDAVVIASHDSTHADLTIAAVAAGKPVLVEKPLAPTVADCERVLHATGAGPSGAHQRSATDLVTVGFMRRFDPGYRALRDSLRGGEIGAAVVVHCVSRGVSAGPGATDESSVVGSTIHDLDTVPWLLGSPVVETSWHAGRSTAGVGFRDPQVMLLRTADGTLTTVETFLNARYGYDIRCEIVGESGALTLREPARVTVDSALARSVAYAADWRARFADAYRLELQAWVNRIRGVRDPLSHDLAGARDGLVATAVAEAVLASMHGDGRFVAVPEIAVAGTGTAS